MIHMPDLLKNGAQQGNRNHCAAKLIGHLLGKGNTESVVWEMISQWNASKNTPPLDHSELRKTFESICDLNRKNSKKDKEKKDIDVAQFLDTEKIVTAEYDEQYVRIPFAGSLLSIMESKMNGGSMVAAPIFLAVFLQQAKPRSPIISLTTSASMVTRCCFSVMTTDGRSFVIAPYSRFSGFEIEDFNNCRLSKSDVETICRNDSVSSISKLKYVVEHTIKLDDWPQLIDQIVCPP